MVQADVVAMTTGVVHADEGHVQDQGRDRADVIGDPVAVADLDPEDVTVRDQTPETDAVAATDPARTTDASATAARRVAPMIATSSTTASQGPSPTSVASHARPDQRMARRHTTTTVTR